MGQQSLLRRLHFEASTIVTSQLKTAAQGDSVGEEAKKLPVAEVARFQAVRGKILGFMIQAKTEPSFALIDKCQAIFDTGSVIWLAPSICTKRDLEVQAAPKDSQQVLKIEAQTLKVKLHPQFHFDLRHTQSGCQVYPVWINTSSTREANALQWATYRIAKKALLLNLGISIENPTKAVNGPLQPLFCEHPGHMNTFHNCMMRGGRDKKTSWWRSDDFFESFNLLCTKDREHKPWMPTVQASTGVHYPTKDEAEYLHILCERVASLIIQDSRDSGILPDHHLVTHIRLRNSTAVNSVAMGILPRGQKSTEAILKTELKGARVTSRKLLTWGEVRVSAQDGKVSADFLETGDIDCDTKLEVVTVGAPDIAGSCHITILLKLTAWFQFVACQWS